ncbi:MAG TPA: hypothetical protein VNY05_29275 [Candidatus Acidoferrales bacterium]|jgi:hypothetical protein|nr:hypothetical protein [Candidatus Acidoferrales bacterium]
MAFADDLLELAQDIANLPADSRRQAIMRRAISTAYYALFHLLISEATLNWARAELRPTLGRLFDHGPMYTASTNKEAELNAYFNNNPAESTEREIAEHLRTVANTFVQAQQRRIDADYNMGNEVTEIEMLTQLETVTEAFKSWEIIRDDATAQAYLLSMLGSKQRREKRVNPPTETKARKNKQPPPTTEPVA